MATAIQRTAFMDLVAKSGLLESDRLQAYFQALEKSGLLSDDAVKLANLMIRDGLLTTFQARQLLGGKFRNLIVLGKYRIMELLGQGGMGSVYLAEHLRFRRPVALKFLPAESRNDADALARFEREGRAIFDLNHPNIVRAFDIDQEGNYHFLVLEYVDGVNLNDLVKKQGPLSTARAANYVWQAANGLRHAHDNGLIHRDIKPGNLLLARDGCIKLLDLGLARYFAEDPETGLTRRHSDAAVMGTADYIAPEQAMDATKVDGRADLYSLGASFYFLLAGQPPFASGNTAQKMLWHQMREPDPIQQFRPDVPPALAEILHHLLAKRPDDRFASAAELAEALAPFAAQPVPLPTSEEMPKHCPAVVQILPQLSASSSQSQSFVNTPISGTYSRPPSLSSFSVSPTTPRPSSGPLSSGLRPGLTTPSPSETLPITQITTSKPPRQALPPLVVYGVLGLVALLAIVVVAGFILFSSSQDSRASERARQALSMAKPGQANQIELTVTRNRKGPDGSYPANCYGSVLEAIASLSPGQPAHIRVVDPIYEDTVVLKRMNLQGVTLQAAPPTGETLVWRAPRGADAKLPLLLLSEVTGLRVAGFDFDGEDSLQTAIVVMGPCPLLRLEELVFRGFVGPSVHLEGGTGNDTGRLTIDRCIFHGPATATEQPVSAIRCDPQLRSHQRPLPLQSFQVIDSCFLGPFYSVWETSASLRDVGFLRNRIARTSAVFRFRAAGEDVGELQRVILGNNTIQEASSLVQLDALPIGQPRGLEARHNLLERVDRFLAIADDTQAEAARALFAPSTAWNLCDTGSCYQGLEMDQHYKRLDFSSLPRKLSGRSTEQFLLYPQDSELSRAGNRGLPIGVPPITSANR